MLFCLIRVVTQTRIYHCFSVPRPPSTYTLSCLAHGSWLGVCLGGLFVPSRTILRSPALPQGWPTPPVPDLRCLYWGELKVTGGETAGLPFSYFTVSPVRQWWPAFSSEVMCTCLFFNRTQFCFLIMIFSHLLSKYTRMLFFVLEDIIVQKSDCFLRGISYWWHYWLSGHGQCEGFGLTLWRFLSAFLKGQHASAWPCPFSWLIGSLSSVLLF